MDYWEARGAAGGGGATSATTTRDLGGSWSSSRPSAVMRAAFAGSAAGMHCAEFMLGAVRTVARSIDGFVERGSPRSSTARVVGECGCTWTTCATHDA